jgi:hypothetical protein
LTELRPFGTALGAPEPWWLGTHLLMPGPWLAPKVRREPRFRSRLPSIRSLRLKRAPEHRAEAAGVLGLGLIPWPEGTRKCTRWI